MVYELVSRSSHWPAVLDLCERVEILESTPDRELVEISAWIQGTLASWQTERHRRPEALAVDTRMIRPMPLVARMATSWQVFDLDAASSLLLLEHEYEIKADVAGEVDGIETVEEASAYIAAAIDRNARRELDDFRRAAEAQADPVRRRQHVARHSVICEADADAVYPLVRDTTAWPELFEACVGTAVRWSDGTTEIVAVYASQAGQVVSWDTERCYHDSIHRVDYRLLVPMPFVESMSGTWRVIPLGPGRCLLTVVRTWQILADVRGIRDDISDAAAAASFVRGYIETNAAAEMDVIRAYVASSTREQTPEPVGDVS